MSNILTASWPVNYLEQYGFVSEVQKEVELIKRRATQVVVKSLTEPTQRQWEDAYFTTTGFPAPIAPGTKLIWFNLKSGRPKLYTTINDSNGGLESSGQVYPYITPNRRSSGFRLIGSIRDGRMVNVFDQLNARYQVGTNALNAGIVYLGTDFNRWSELNLQSLMILFSFKTTLVGSGWLAVSFYYPPNSWLDTAAGAGPVVAGSHMAVFTLGANTITDWGLGSTYLTVANGTHPQIIPAADFADSTSSVQTEGVIYITGLTWQKDYLTQGFSHPFGSYSGVCFGSASRALTTGNIRHFHSLVQKYDDAPAYMGVPPFSVPVDNVNTVNSLDQVNGSYFRASIYGMFAGNTPFDLGEF